MEQLTSVRELFLTELNDAYSAEKQMIEALPKMAEAASTPAVKKKFEQHLTQTEKQAERLEAEIAEIEQQHVSQYEMVGDPNESPLTKATLMQLCEAYNFYSCAQTETDPRIKSLWEKFTEYEIEHFHQCNALLNRYEGMDIRDAMSTEVIEPLIVFEPNKEYVNEILETQVQLQPLDMEFVDSEDLPPDWASFRYQDKVNAGGVPSEQVVDRAKTEAKIPQLV